jgi:hypothetical protein
MLCVYCQEIDFTLAEPLREKEADSDRWRTLPEELQPTDLAGLYHVQKHHATLPELFDCSANGCHFCLQIRQELFHLRGHESEQAHHQGYVEMRYYNQNETEENCCLRLEVFVVAVTAAREIKLTFDFIRPPGKQPVVLQIKTLILTKRT